VVGTALKLKVKVVITDGSQPVGRGIGPALEALDVLSVLKNQKNAPADLRERSLQLAAEILELAGSSVSGEGYAVANELLSSGVAWKKFKAICKAQGGLKTPRPAKYKKDVRALRNGVVKEIDNRKLAKIAKLAGAPQDPGAGVMLKVRVGTRVKKGDGIYTVYADALGELNYAFNFLRSQKNIITIS
jgi:thymidine phosphorylase